MKTIVYLKATADFDLLIEKSNDLRCTWLKFDLKTHVDADYPRKVEDRRYVPGVAICCRGTLVPCCPRTQECVIIYATEAGYVATAYGVKEALYGGEFEGSYYAVRVRET